MKSPIEREKSDARINSSEREVTRPKVKRDMPERLQKALLGFALGFVLMMVLDVVMG
jgi:hypothetical protein